MIPESIQRYIDRQAERSPSDYSDLRAVFLNGTLKRSPEVSHTEGLMAISVGLLRALGVQVDVVRTVDHVIPPGVQPDMRLHGWERDDFPSIYHELIEPADIIVLATPIWLGDQSSQTRLVIERLYGWSGEVNAAGQWSYYGKVGGALITGNEDGGKHCAAQICTPCSTSAWPSLRSPMSTGTGKPDRDRRTSMSPAGSATPGPPGTPSS